MFNKELVEDSYKKFNDLLYEKRVTISQVCKAVEISATTITCWKQAKYEPKGRTMYKIAKFLDVPISYFYE